MTAPDLPSLIEVIRGFGLEPRKALGQNFLLDQRLTHRIATAAGPLDGIGVVEIGPGPGGLTRALLAAGARRVVAIERDERCLAALADLAAAYPGRLEVIAADALTLDPLSLIEPPRRIIANLPYNIATALLTGWLPRIDQWDGFTLMFQREVAERLTARPRTKAYGRLTILTQWLAEARIAFDLPPGAFLPAPKVVSSVVLLTPRPAPLAPANLPDLERITAAAFGQRRKMLRASLRGLAPDAEARLEAAGITPTRRAEELSVAEFCTLARVFAVVPVGADPIGS